MENKEKIIDILPKDIKTVTKISFILTLICFIIGVITGISYIYISLTIGMIASNVGGFLMIYDVYKLIYLGQGNKITVGIFGKLKRLLIYIIALLTVIFLSKKYFDNDIRLDIIFTGVGLLNYKISMLFYQMYKLIKK